ncbi:beta-N-acetylhexosaminidase [Paraclostridium bifermentans]|uniref:beta-N-acetylhexosaminidase n=1 Tax=Paraclostridium bifermentans TaxID=1490 RepID=UPI001158E3EC|nr:beta-N-acetylhexosaminidase [Paraclostridium bifermentans]TQO57539.1 beta-N-acetylhexosaminidase [Paraclostridium bifermentans]
MKLNLLGIDDQMQKEVFQIKRVLDIDFDISGETVYVYKLNEEDELDIEVERGIIKYKNKHHLFRAISLYAQNEGDEKLRIKEKQKIKYIGPMIDVSRNCVYKVDKLKDIIVSLSILGFNQMMLYTEDTYEIENLPYFGYLRGKYSSYELKEIDDFAESLGIEVIPCIQTLAHLKQTLKWEYAKDIKDTEDVLLVGNKKTYDFIETMIRSLRMCFKSNKIHIGMDEAFDLGRGRYLDQNGYTHHYKIMVEHLKEVCRICDSYEFKPMMWDDMFFRTGSPNGFYYDQDAVISEEVVNSIPENLSLVYWDYYHKESDIYRKFFEIRKVFDKKVIFAGGIWKWSGIVPCYDQTFKSMNEAMIVCKEKGIDEVIITAWGDDGDETPIDTILPGLILFSQHTYSDKVNMKCISEKCKFITKLNLENFFELQNLDKIEDGDSENLRFVNPSKYLLYQDILLGAFDKHIDKLVKDKGTKFLELHYSNLSEKLLEIADKNEVYYDMYKLYSDLAKVLSIKATVGLKIRTFYKNKDRYKLKQICEPELKNLLIKIDNLQNSFRKLWYKECKGQGFEVIDIRLGGVKSRVVSTLYRLESYIREDIDIIEELEEDLLMYNCVNAEKSNQINLNRYKDIATQNIISW